MKKKVFFLCVFFISMVFLSMTSGLTGDAITGELITGEASAQSTNVSIFVLPAIPLVSILNPENKTYLSNESILLSFSISNEDFIWYNIDGGSNITITASINFNVSQGSHTLNLYANNSAGEKNQTITFTANSTKFIISYTEYSGSTKGSSTDFNASTFEDIQNFSDIILEHATHGKITFNVALNLTDDLNFSDRLLDLDLNTNISSNRIELNSTALPNFNKSATLILYGLSFSNPRVLIDGSVCSSSVCTENSYSGGDFSFNVTQFTIYSAGETPVEDTGDTGGGGGGGTSGGGGTIVQEIIKLDKNRISITLKQGGSKSEEVVITNVGSSLRNITLEISEVGGFVNLSEESFGLEPNESRTIILNFFANESVTPDLYQGKLIVRSGSIRKEVFIAIEVETVEALFDVTLEIPKAFLQAVPGGEVVANIRLFELQQVGKVEVAMEYFITDSEGKLIISDAEILEVDKEISFVKSLKIPLETVEGDYLYYVRVTYADETASASEWFEVRLKTLFEKILPPFVVVIIILIVITIIILLSKRLWDELQILRQHKKPSE